MSVLQYRHTGILWHFYIHYTNLTLVHTLTVTHTVHLLQRGGRVSTISQVTASQVHSAVESGENSFKIDDREVGMVSLA